MIRGLFVAGVAMIAMTGSAMACTITDSDGRQYPLVSEKDCAEIARIGLTQWRANMQAARRAQEAKQMEDSEAMAKASEAAAATKQAADDAAAVQHEKGKTIESICDGVEDAYSAYLTSKNIRFHMLGAEAMWCQNGTDLGGLCLHTTRTSFNVSVAKPPHFHLACVAAIIWLDPRREQEFENHSEIQMNRDDISLNRQVQIAQ
jgi:hypothetical protein